MSIYKNILFATDLTDDIYNINAKVRKIADMYNAELNIVHVVENLATISYYEVVTIQDQLKEEATKEIRKIGQKLNVEEKHQHIELGHPKHEILDCAERLNSDLIIVGSHGRTGLSTLLGSTCNAVIHGAHCDVLVIRAKKD